MDEMLFRVFADHVGRYLDSVDRRCAANATSSLAVESRRLVAAWRALLDLHQPTGPGGRCAGCDPRAGRGAATARLAAAVRRRGHAMCTVWRVASAYFARRLTERDGS